MTEFTKKIAQDRLSKQKQAEVERRHAEIMALLKALIAKNPSVKIGQVTAESDKDALKSISEAIKLLLTVNEQSKTLGGQFGGIANLLEDLTRRLEGIPSEFSLSDTRPDRTDDILLALKELGSKKIDFPKFPDIPKTDTKSVVEAVEKVEGVLRDILNRPQVVGLSGGGGGDSEGGATLAEQQTQTTHLSAIETAVEALEAGQLPDGHNVTIDNASIAVTGTFWQATQPVSGTVTANLSAVDNAVLDNIDAELTTIIGHVDGLETLIGTTNTTLTTIDGRVDGIEALLTTIDSDTGNLVTIETNTDFGTVVGGGTETGALRVTIANNSTGVLSVDDNGSTLSIDDGGGVITVDGTVTANLGATDNSVLDSIDEAVSSQQISGIGHGVKTVTTAGSHEALAGSTACKRVTIQAQTDNTSAVAVGGDGVDATVSTGTGILLFPGDVFELDIDNLADVFVDSLVNGEGVRYVWFD